MPDNPPTPSPAQNDDIPIIHINLPSCYLKPAGSVEPQLPDGTFSCDAQENFWKPLPNDPKRQEFRIQGKNELVFIAGAQYTYKPNTSLHIKCKKATFMPHPTDASHKTVMVRMPGANAEQNLPVKAKEGKSGTEAKYRFDGFGEAVTLDRFPKVISSIDEATRGGDGMDGAIGFQGADAGSLIIEADSYDTSALPDDKVFFIADCTGGRGQQGGDGGDGGSGGDGAVTAGTYSGELQTGWGFSGICGAKGGDGGRQGAGGYGGSGGQFTINLPKESTGYDKLKARFGVESNTGTSGTTGAAGKPGSGGGYGEWRQLKCSGTECSMSKFLMNGIPKDQLMAELRSKLELDWSSEQLNRCATSYISRTESFSVSGNAPKALDEKEIQNRRAEAGQYPPTTSSTVVFKELKKQ
ncbi:uncharacterized protein FPRO_12781 [Fusarium proliferatum ET1]|uniref:Uncharacterized protein n=1 Tax=Fusarium proliferatum (strain ET1) TaxID=1227346 RepID=A0A1L7W721_FUSPR|nr:uncharacterized protein FPRO_12781 [Fusarium proliferatum ET1]CZR48171.1 uncharacterized protein FPRO_12781 [Fusarium proliferatum ET1]